LPRRHNRICCNYHLHQEHRPSYELLDKIWGTDRQPPVKDHFRTPSILDLRIMANLKSQRGEFDEALKIINQAKARSSDAEGRLDGLEKLIKKRRDEAGESKD